MPLSNSHVVLPSELHFLKPIIVPDLVRLGNPGDGGYVLSGAALQNTDMLISFGVSNDWSLEDDLSTRDPDLLVHAYDHTISANNFLALKRRELLGVIFGAIKLFLLQLTPGQVLARVDSYNACRKTCDNYRRYFNGKNHKHFQERVFNRAETESDATIDRVFARASGKSHIFLKIDIEGGEYRIIEQVLKFEDRIDIMLIEFHDTDPLRSIFTEQVNSIRRSFNIIHIHGNNNRGVARDGLPDVLEITFLNKRFPIEERYRNQLPLGGLDFPNNANRSDHIITW